MGNPFGNHKDYYSVISNTPFSKSVFSTDFQQTSVVGEDSGICLALVFFWLNDFLSIGSIEFTQFFNNVKKQEFINLAVDRQSTTHKAWPPFKELDNSRARARTDALVYGLTDSNSYRESVDGMHTNLSRYFAGNATKGFAALVMLMDDATSIGHALGVVVRNGCYSIFDPNQGELRFFYDDKVNLENRTADVLDEMGDRYEYGSKIKTYIDALDDLLLYYREHFSEFNYRVIYLQPKPGITPAFVVAAADAAAAAAARADAAAASDAAAAAVLASNRHALLAQSVSNSEESEESAASSPGAGNSDS